jgi:hypothetical protein
MRRVRSWNRPGTGRRRRPTRHHRYRRSRGTPHPGSAHVDPPLLPPDPAVAADAADLVVAGVLQRRQPTGIGPRRRGVVLLASAFKSRAAAARGWPPPAHAADTPERRRTPRGRHPPGLPDRFRQRPDMRASCWHSDEFRDYDHWGWRGYHGFSTISRRSRT